MKYLNKFTREKMELIQEKAGGYTHETKRNSPIRRGVRTAVPVQSHKVILSSDDNEEVSEHEREIKKKARELYALGNFRTLKDAEAHARQMINREGK